ncbi:hypothetical protein [Pseudomonas sp.]|uniref:hypothetical protein n=1 Tax=Pseudomonas sp. TaxID=306 RepID=UPI00258D31BB|nr:hypothetical protein [Pseudomonas sp.]
MDFFTFTLIGLFTGAMGGWAAFAFGSKTGKVDGAWELTDNLAVDRCILHNRWGVKLTKQSIS